MKQLGFTKYALNVCVCVTEKHEEFKLDSVICIQKCS